MLVTIQLWRLRIDIRADRDLLARLKAVEEEADRLREDYRQLEAAQEDFVSGEDIPDVELIEEYLADVTRLQHDLGSMDFWKADRNHSHPQYAERPAEDNQS